MLDQQCIYNSATYCAVCSKLFRFHWSCHSTPTHGMSFVLVPTQAGPVSLIRSHCKSRHARSLVRLRLQCLVTPRIKWELQTNYVNGKRQNSLHTRYGYRTVLQGFLTAVNVHEYYLSFQNSCVCFNCTFCLH